MQKSQNDDFMQKFDWAGFFFGFIEIPKKIKPQKTIFFSAVLFKGTKKFQVFDSEPQKIIREMN